MRDHELDRRRFLTMLGAAGVSAAALPALSATAAARPAMLMTLIGSYSSSTPAGNGLDVAHRTAGGALHPAGTVEGVPDASFLAWSPDHRYLYATNEREEGTITALDLTGHMPKVINKGSSRGAGPTHLTVHPSGKFILTANYTSGSIVVHRRNADGSIGESTDLVKHTGGARAAKAHQVLVDPRGGWVSAVDLGADSVYLYGLDLGTGKLTEHQRLKLATGSGPRHLAFHPSGQHAYVLCELRSEIRVLTFDWRAGKFTEGQVIGTRAPDASGENYPAEIATSDDGQFVYASNRGDNTIATFALDGGPQRLKLLDNTPTGGDWPRHFTLDPEQRSIYVSNQNSGTVTRLPRNPDTGRLQPPTDEFKYPSVAMLTFHH